jgi:hypothetical protein
MTLRGSQSEDSDSFCFILVNTLAVLVAVA